MLRFQQMNIIHMRFSYDHVVERCSQIIKVNLVLPILEITRKTNTIKLSLITIIPKNQSFVCESLLHLVCLFTRNKAFINKSITVIIRIYAMNEKINDIIFAFV